MANKEIEVAPVKDRAHSRNRWHTKWQSWRTNSATWRRLRRVAQGLTLTLFLGLLVASWSAGEAAVESHKVVPGKVSQSRTG